MKRFNAKHLFQMGEKLFQKVVRQKRFANHNHDVHFLARELNSWLPAGIQTLSNGTYNPQPLKRYYFPDEMVDQLHIADRILQHLILQQLKPTFKYVMSPNCYHLHGPSGVKLATQRICQILQTENPKYVLRVDIKSYYKSIQHHKLLGDIKQYYDDPKLHEMLTNIIKNPIETPRGYKNPDHGIALREPLSQFLSGIFLKKLDDVFEKTKAHYLRFQDDILILCQTKRQLNRCKRRLKEILHKRRLSLSGKKSYIGSIHKGFHFLGIHYLPTQPEDHTTKVPASNDSTITPDLFLTMSGGVAQLLNVCSKGLYVWCRMHAPYVKHASR